MLGELHRLRLCWSQLRQHPDDFGNDFAGLAYHDGVPDVEVQLRDAVGVVQGGAADAGARQRHGVEFRHGGDSPRAPDLDDDPTQCAGGFLRRELEGDGPARSLLGEARGILQTQIVELHHHTIGGVGEVVALLLPAIAERLNAAEVRAKLPVGIHPKAGALKPGQGIPLRVRLGSAGEMDRVREEVQPPGGHHLGIQLPQGAGAGIAWVGEQRFSALPSLGIDRREGVIGDEGFAAHFHPLRWIVDLQPQRNRADGAHVGGDLLTATPVAAGGRTLQYAVAVTQCQGVAVDLELADHRQARARGAVEHLQQSLLPGAEVLTAEGVVQAEQANAVIHAGEPLAGWAADALGGAVGCLQARILLLKLQQFPIEAVIDRIGHLRCIEHVIRVGGAVEERAQFAGALPLIRH